MLTPLALLSVVVAACIAGCSSTKPAFIIAEHVPAGIAARPAMPATLRVSGEGTEVHPIHAVASLGEVHEALVRAGARRITTPAEADIGLELVILQEARIDPVVRAIVPTSPPSIEWLGFPVRWTTLAAAGDEQVAVRSWPVITELGPRAIVEVRVDDGNGNSHKRELLLVPGEALAITASGGEWPAPIDQVEEVDFLTSRAFGRSGDNPLGLVLLVPRFHAR